MRIGLDHRYSVLGKGGEFLDRHVSPFVEGHDLAKRWVDIKAKLLDLALWTGAIAQPVT